MSTGSPCIDTNITWLSLRINNESRVSTNFALLSVLRGVSCSYGTLLRSNISSSLSSSLSSVEEFFTSSIVAIPSNWRLLIDLGSRGITGSEIGGIGRCGAKVLGDICWVEG